MNDSRKQLHFIALVPPNPLRDKLQEIRERFRDEFNSKHALKSPPHITLLSPFKLEKSLDSALFQVLKNFAGKRVPVPVRLENYSHFGSRVIFIDVKQRDELMELQQDLENLARENPDIFNYNYDERPYHPHLTLSFKDLSKSDYDRAWKEFSDKSFHAEFVAVKLYLLRHNGKKCEIIKDFSMSE